MRAILCLAAVIAASPAAAGSLPSDTVAVYGPVQDAPAPRTSLVGASFDLATLEGSAVATAATTARASAETAAAPFDNREQRASVARLHLRQSALRWERYYLALSAIDAAQTIYAVQSGRGVEANPLLGRNPSVMKVLAFKTIGGALHYTAVRKLSLKNPRQARTVAIVSTAIQAGVVGLNMRVVL